MTFADVEDLKPHIPALDRYSESGGEFTNGRRAERGLAAAEAYARTGGPTVEDECILRDLICDLLHYGHSQGWDVAEEVEFAVDGFLYENGDKKKMNDERGSWTSASNAQADELCPGRHLASRDLKDERSSDSDFGDAIHQALAKQKDEGLPPDQADIYEACNDITTRLMSAYFGPEYGKAKVSREQRYWAHWTKADKTLAFSHSGRADLTVVAGVRAMVIDYKTLAGEVAASSRNQQLRDLAVLLKNQTIVTNEVAVAVVQPLVTYEPELCVYDLDSLNRSGMELFERVRKSNDPASPRVAGELQCKFCKAKLQCQQYQTWYGASVPQLKSLTEVPVASWTPEQRKEYCDRRDIAYKWLATCDSEMEKGLTADPNFIPGYWMEPGDFREPVVKLQELFERFSAMGGTLPNFLKCLKMTKEQFEAQVAELNKEKGKALKATMRNLYKDLTLRVQNKSSLSKRKETK